MDHLIRAALAPTADPELRLHGSAGAVAAQALRRIAETGRGVARGGSRLTVLHSGRTGPLAGVAARYPQGRLVAAGSAESLPAPAATR